MAGAMARGWASMPSGAPSLLFCDSGSGRAARLAAELGGEARGGLEALARDSDFVCLAVKPKQLGDVAAAMGGRAGGVLSVLGATPLAALREAFPSIPLLRCMPTIATELRRGVIAHAPLEPADGELGARMLALLGELGRLAEVDDELMDAATAVMGNTPAYLALVAGALADAGAREGLDPTLSLGLVAETLESTAELLRVRQPRALTREIASPGGSTEAGLALLEQAGIADSMAGAVRAAMQRMGH